MRYAVSNFSKPQNDHPQKVALVRRFQSINLPSITTKQV